MSAIGHGSLRGAPWPLTTTPDALPELTSYWNSSVIVTLKLIELGIGPMQVGKCTAYNKI